MRRHFSPLIAGAAFAVLAFPACAADDQDVIGRFGITRFDIQGNTILSQQAIDTAVTPFTGNARNFGDVQKALEALEAAYRRRGFNVVQVLLPEQELNNGVVTFRIIETRLGKIKVEGNKAFDEANIRRSVPPLVEGQTPNIAAVSAALRLANENPAKKVSLRLQGGDQDDEINAVLKVADERPWTIGANLDNTGSSSIGKTRLTVQYQHANVADLDHVVSLQYSTTVEKPDQVAAYGIGYRIPLYGSGDSIDLFASYSNSDFNLDGTNLQVTGKGSMLGGRYNQSLRRSGDYESKLVYGLDQKAYRSTLQGIQFGDVTVRPVSIAYTGSLSMTGAEAGFGLTAVRNLPGGSRGGRADFNNARTGADPGYSLLRYSGAYSRVLADDWQMRVALSGQFTSDALVPGEQFGAGGGATVRGFDERDIANDKGHLFNAEIYTPNLCGGIQPATVQCRAVGFYDVARAMRNRALPGEQARASIASVGVGMRMSIDKYLSLQLDYGHVIDSGNARVEGDGRLHFRLGLSY